MSWKKKKIRNSNFNILQKAAGFGKFFPCPAAFLHFIGFHIFILRRSSAVRSLTPAVFLFLTAIIGWFRWSVRCGIWCIRWFRCVHWLLGRSSRWFLSRCFRWRLCGSFCVLPSRLRCRRFLLLGFLCGSTYLVRL